MLSELFPFDGAGPCAMELQNGRSDLAERGYSDAMEQGAIIADELTPDRVTSDQGVVNDAASAFRTAA